MLVVVAFPLVVATAAEELPRQYREPFAKSWPVRKKQHLQMKAYLDGFPARDREMPEARFRLDLSSGKAYERSGEPIRDHLKKVGMLPPPKAVVNPTPRFELAGQDQAADIYRVA